MMSNRRNRRSRRGRRKGAFGRALDKTKLAANVTEEAEWYLDVPDVRLTRIFSVVLILHVVAVGGILAFKMIDKAADGSALQFSSASKAPSEAVSEEKAVAARAGEDSSNEVPAAVPADAPAQPAALKTTSANPTGKAGNGENQYKVQVGDKLPDIASKLGVDAGELRRINAIRSDNELYPGRWLDLPGSKAAAEASAAAAVKDAPAEAVDRPSTYVIQSGDTAWGISQKLGVGVNELMRHNRIDKPETLQVGQTLKVP